MGVGGRAAAWGQGRRGGGEEPVRGEWGTLGGGRGETLGSGGRMRDWRKKREKTKRMVNAPCSTLTTSCITSKSVIFRQYSATNRKGKEACENWS